MLSGEIQDVEMRQKPQLLPTAIVTELCVGAWWGRVVVRFSLALNLLRGRVQGTQFGDADCNWLCSCGVGRGSGDFLTIVAL